jgi:pimeloyl-ACP methyl ester carboxylesterase
MTVENLRSADGTSIAFEWTGTGPALILVDGAMCYRGAGPMGPLAALLASEFTVFTYDRRGRGQSADTSPYAIDREIEDLAALVEAAGGSAYAYGVSSGAVLALLGAERGLDIPALALFEPPLSAQPGNLRAELAELVAAGRMGDAVEHFQLSIGIPAEAVAEMRHAPFRAALEAIAPTLVYDTTITGSLPIDRLASIGTPALVVASAESAGPLRSAAEAVAHALPNGRHITLPGRFHDVPAEDLAPALGEFFGRSPVGRR